MLRYIRLLSYENACKVVDFVNNNDKTDFACITMGGTKLNVKDENWEKVLDFIKSLGVPYEINKEHPIETKHKIVEGLKEKGIIK